MNRPTNQVVPDCPYVGLQPYSEAEREFFFGREQDTETIAANLLTAPLTLLYGASGVGKTSVLAAGVVPNLRAMPDVLVVLFWQWQDETFLTALESGIASEAKQSPTNAEIAPSHPSTRSAPSGSLLAMTGEPFDEFLARVAQQTNRTLLIILDQFEEYFLYHPNANPFDEQFARAVNRGDVNANFLLSLREDALSQLDRFETRIPNLMSNGLRLEHLNREGAEHAIRKPLDVYNAQRPDTQPVTIEDALVDTLIEQVRTGRVTLGQKAGQSDVGTAPSADVRIETTFLQMVLTRLWEEMRVSSPVLRLETQQHLGGAKSIVKGHLIDVMEKLKPEDRRIADRLFYYLVTSSGSKNVYTADDLAEYTKLPQKQIARVLEQLSGPNFRILHPIPSLPGQFNLPRYEIFHEVLSSAILDRRRWNQEWEGLHPFSFFEPMVTFYSSLRALTGLIATDISRAARSPIGAIVIAVAVALIGVGIIIGQRLDPSGLPVSPSLVVPLWTGLILLGWFVFRQDVYRGAWGAFTRQQKVILKTEKTPFEYYMTAVNSCIVTLIGGSILVIITLNVAGHGDVAVLILQMVLQKLIRVIEALLS